MSNDMDRMHPVDVTIVVELLLRRPGTIVDGREIAGALRRIGIDATADIVDVRVILGTLTEVVDVASAARLRRPNLHHGLQITDGKDDELVLLAAEGR